jgi:hypothetical protein
MTNDKQSQTVSYKGKTIVLTNEVMESLIGKEGLFTDVVSLLSNQTSTFIGRSGEKSSQNYNVKLSIKNLVVGNRRMGGNLWLQPLAHTTDEEDIGLLSKQFPEAEVKLTERKVVN